MAELIGLTHRGHSIALAARCWRALWRAWRHALLTLGTELSGQGCAAPPPLPIGTWTAVSQDTPQPYVRRVAPAATAWWWARPRDGAEAVAMLRILLNAGAGDGVVLDPHGLLDTPSLQRVWPRCMRLARARALALWLVAPGAREGAGRLARYPFAGPCGMQKSRAKSALRATFHARGAITRCTPWAVADPISF